MGTINVLPPSIFNLLAAGEVVENPAAVVKECVENSLDAGATKIEIAIMRGGLDQIRITDNGSGVEADQIDKVFLPHATSKISGAKDLEQIGMLGFRGEALSSIAAVSQTEFITKTQNAKFAIIYPAKKLISGNTGSAISISNLFYNTPARKKFLSSPNTEKNNVTSVVSRLILAEPAVSFKYTIDGDVIYDFRGKTLLDAVKAVYSDITNANILEVKAKTDKFSLAGYISVPNFTKRNRTYQTLIVNGRAVEGGTVGDAVNAAFSNYMTVGSFPFFVLHLAVDTREVDVNVHPRKAQIKFSAEQEIFDFVKRAVTDTVDAYLYDRNKNFVSAERDNELLSKIKHFSSSGGNTYSVKSAPHIMNKYDTSETQRQTEIAAEIIKQKPPEQIKFTELPDFKIMGSIFDTYILVSRNENFFIIDQHAAHERLLYDELKQQVDTDTVAVQRLLDPEVMVLNTQEMNKMEAAAPILNRIGIECAPFGTNCFRIASVPVAVLPHGVGTVIENILHDVKNTAPEKLSAILQDKIITQCCRAAIKAGQSLNNEQIKFFLEQFDDKKNMRPTCPHGRPIIISYSRGQIEKLFSR